MPRITLEVDQLKDLQLIIELAKRLKIRFLLQDDADLLDETEARKRAQALRKFQGTLADKQGYQVSEQEWYEQ